MAGASVLKLLHCHQSRPCSFHSVLRIEAQHCRFIANVIIPVVQFIDQWLCAVDLPDRERWNVLASHPSQLVCWIDNFERSLVLSWCGVPLFARRGIFTPTSFTARLLRHIRGQSLCTGLRRQSSRLRG